MIPRGHKVKQLTLLPLTPVEQVFEIFRKVNHYSLKKLLPSLQLKLENVPIEITEKALEIYQKKCTEDRKAPHPNYFITVCIRLSKEEQGHSYKQIDDKIEDLIVIPLARMI